MLTYNGLPMVPRFLYLYSPPRLLDLPVCLSVLKPSFMSDSLQPHELQHSRLSVHGILQAGILEWVATTSSRRYSTTAIKPSSPALDVDSFPQSPGTATCILCYSIPVIWRQAPPAKSCRFSWWEPSNESLQLGLLSRI